MNSHARPQSDARPSRFLPWGLGLLLVLGCVAIYQHVGEFGFLTFDDEYNIVFNPHMGPLTLERVRWAFSDSAYMRRWIPLGWLGYSAEFSVSGLNPVGYHLAGLVFHAINSLLFFRLLWLLTQFSPAGSDSRNREWTLLGAFLGAVFWAWHPLRVESVAWVAALLYWQAEFFLLLAFIGFVRAPAKPGSRAGALLGYTASLLTSPFAIGFAPVFALVAWWRLRDWRRAAWIAVPFFVVGIIVMGINVAARVGAAADFIPAPTLTQFPPIARVMQLCYVWTYFAWIPFWPTTLTLFNPVLVNFNPGSAPFVLSAVVVVAAIVTCVAWPRARRTAGVFVLAHLCVLVPMAGLLERPHFPSDRYSAFPQAILAAALVLGLLRLRSARARFLVV
ncbi:MAG: hypothetical protein ABI222_15435, partial [Opitutaceae bacterium]